MPGTSVVVETTYFETKTEIKTGKFFRDQDRDQDRSFLETSGASPRPGPAIVRPRPAITGISNISEESLALCGRIINPLVLTILSTGDEEAGIHNVCLNSLKGAGNSPLSSLFSKFENI